MSKATDCIKGRDPASLLQKAVVRYVESMGGYVVVIGEIYVRGDELSFLDGSFNVCIKCTGRSPKKAAPSAYAGG